MRRFTLLCCAAVLVGCAKTEDRPATDSAAVAATAAPPATLSLADVAGKWTVRATNEAGDSIVTYVMTATADTSGWTFTFPKRKPVPVRVVAVDGDSVVTEAGPYESVLRKGVQVTTRNVTRLQGGKLVGTTKATYAGGGADSVLMARTEGTREP
ncbi:MAG: hypothetical protein ACREMX_04005 [Gemmatimonadales bacterium]